MGYMDKIISKEVFCNVIRAIQREVMRRKDLCEILKKDGVIDEYFPYSGIVGGTLYLLDHISESACPYYHGEIYYCCLETEFGEITPCFLEVHGVSIKLDTPEFLYDYLNGNPHIDPSGLEVKSKKIETWIKEKFESCPINDNENEPKRVCSDCTNIGKCFFLAYLKDNDVGGSDLH